MDYVMVNNELYHHGILGQKWGVRRYQKKDGTLTNAGKKRYNYKDSETYKNASSSKKSEMTIQYTYNKKAFGKRSANKMQYEHYEQNKNMEKLRRKEYGKRTAIGLGMYITALNYEKILDGRRSAQIYIYGNNRAAQAAMEKYDLNEVVGGFTFNPIPAINRGKKFYEKLNR